MGGSIETKSLQIVFPRRDVTSADGGLFTPQREAEISPGSSQAAGEARLDMAPRLPELELQVAAWRSDDFPFWRFDRQVDALVAAPGGGAFAVRLHGERQHLTAAAGQVVVRCQRLAGRRNDASRCDVFERVLSGHRRLFAADASPSAAGAAQHARALDRWQWLLRLDPGAGLEPQIAALFHDVERLTAARQAEPRRGSWIADELLVDLQIDLATRVRVHELIRGHERSHQPVDLGGSAARELRQLRNADALSFFSLDSAAYLASAGAESTRRKVAGALGRLSPDCRAHLDSLRLCQALRQMIAGEMARLADAERHRTVPASRTTTGSDSRTAGERSPRPNPLADRVIGPSGVLGAIDSLGRRDGRPSPASVMSRSRLAVGMLGGAALAPTRLAPLLARAQALGALGAGTVSPSAHATAAESTG